MLDKFFFEVVGGDVNLRGALEEQNKRNYLGTS
jgi:hypothetical protein